MANGGYDMAIEIAHAFGARTLGATSGCYWII
jgi:hypothetical protein